jgi:hypothetical protein
MLAFLNYKEEIMQGYEDGTVNSMVMNPHHNAEVQKVIFDKHYTKFLK